MVVVLQVVPRDKPKCPTALEDSPRPAYKCRYVRLVLALGLHFHKSLAGEQRRRGVSVAIGRLGSPLSDSTRFRAFLSAHRKETIASTAGRTNMPTSSIPQ